ncbi:MAG: DUF4097 family beta strand repeat-containing protein [Pyrinomonadaceae bacterium]
MKRLFQAAFLITVAAVSTQAQDFQKSYQASPDSTLSVKNASGNITIIGDDGNAIVVSAYKEGRDRDRVEIEDLSAGNNVDVRAKYPERCSNDCQASVRFEIRVPRQVNINIDKVSTASGDIKVSTMRGRVRVSTASGDVRVKDVAGAINASSASGDVEILNVSGVVSAQTASGNVTAEIAQLEGSESMKFSTASGDVAVRMPSNLEAEVEMSTISGKVETDFPLQVEEQRHGPGSNARGRLGNNARSLRITSASGNVSLKTLGTAAR